MASSKEDEVRAIEEAHRAAQARLGIAGAYLAMAEWGNVSTLNSSASGASWVQRSLRMIFAIRRKSTRLAVAYIRLVRALETGYTLEFPEYSDDPETLTMGDLRGQFHTLLLDIADLDTAGTDTDDEDEQWFEEELRRAEKDPIPRDDRITFSDSSIDEQIQDWLDNSSTRDDDTVRLDEFDWGLEPSKDDIADFFQKVLDDEVVKDYEKKVKQLRSDEEASTSQQMAKIDKAFEAKRSLAGGRVDRYGINGGREIIDKVLSKDRRVKAFARGTRPNCCAFCALLASRGYVYTSEFGAVRTTKKTSRGGNDVAAESFDDNGIRKYHDNCHCYTIVRFIDVPTLPEQSEYWAQAYKDNIQGKYSYSNGRNNALNAWRKWLNQDRITQAGGTVRKRGRPRKTT